MGPSKSRLENRKLGAGNDAKKLGSEAREEELERRGRKASIGSVNVLAAAEAKWRSVTLGASRTCLRLSCQGIRRWNIYPLILLLVAPEG